MTQVNRIIEDLNVMKTKLNLYIYPINTDTLFCFLNGLERCFLLTFDSTELKLKFRELGDARRKVIQSRGWKHLSITPDYEMREKCMSEEDIIQELIEIDIEKWKLWEKWQNEKAT